MENTHFFYRAPIFQDLLDGYNTELPQHQLWHLCAWKHEGDKKENRMRRGCKQDRGMPLFNLSKYLSAISWKDCQAAAQEK